MDLEKIEQYAIDHPDDAQNAMNQDGLRPTAKDFEYLRFLLTKLKGIDDRKINPEWRGKGIIITGGETSQTGD